MIGSIKTIDVTINGEVYQITKLYARDSYSLFLKCSAILSPILSSVLKNFKNMKENIFDNLDGLDIDVKSIMNTITEKFSFDEVMSLLKASGIRKNYKEISDAEWNVSSPFLIIDLFSEVIKLNIWQDLMSKKKDFEEKARIRYGLESSSQTSSEKVI